MCCGKSRAQFRQGIPSFRPSRPARLVRAEPQFAQYPGATLQYIGRVGLTVVGAATGRQYRFDGQGSRVEVDPRDRSSVASIPILRPVPQSPPKW
jgi:hypothetical protein